MDQPVTNPLPDVADDAAFAARTLDWVGMERIALPLKLADGQGGTIQVPAWADVSVNLGKPEVRGIHMSRLYLRVQDAFAGEAVTAAGMRRILEDLVESQRGLSTAARIVLRYGHLLRRPALQSANSGWKNYPVELESKLVDGRFSLQIALSVEYSSTCPASAALSRQANADRFLAEFSGSGPLAPASVAEWLASERGMAATPHAQRSRADLRVTLNDAFDELPLADLVEGIEAALGTPVQTAVKREDEQAFARLNADNLMFCEDAARRVAAVLAADGRVARFEARVSHFESLHAHDAVAHVSG